MYLLSLLGPQDLARASAISGVGCLFFAVVMFARAAIFPGRTPPPESAQIPGARERLAGTSSRQWAEEEELWRLNDPYPLPVRWDVTATAVAAR